MRATTARKQPMEVNDYAALNYLGMAENLGGIDLIDPLLYLTNGQTSPSFGSSEDGRYVFRGPDNTSQGVVKGDSAGLHWFRWDFGEGNGKTISEIMMIPRRTYSYQYPAKFDVQSSHDDVNWFTEFSVDYVDDPTFVTMRG